MQQALEVSDLAFVSCVELAEVMQFGMCALDLFLGPAQLRVHGDELVLLVALRGEQVVGDALDRGLPALLEMRLQRAQDVLAELAGLDGLGVRWHDHRLVAAWRERGRAPATGWRGRAGLAVLGVQRVRVSGGRDLDDHGLVRTAARARLRLRHGHKEGSSDLPFQDARPGVRAPNLRRTAAQSCPFLFPHEHPVRPTTPRTRLPALCGALQLVGGPANRYSRTTAKGATAGPQSPRRIQNRGSTLRFCRNRQRGQKVADDAHRGGRCFPLTQNHSAAWQQYTAGGRADLAENELKEADFLATFLPQQKSEAEIDTLLRQILAEQPEPLPAEPSKAQLGRLTGTVIKAFKSTVDLTTVDMEVVAKRLQAILAEKASPPA